MRASHFPSVYHDDLSFLHCVNDARLMLKMALSGGDATAVSAKLPMGVDMDTSGAAGSTSGTGTSLLQTVSV